MKQDINMCKTIFSNITLFLASIMFISCSATKDVSTFVVLPDTQTYLEQCPEVFDSQIDWLVANRNKIDAVATSPKTTLPWSGHTCRNHLTE